MNSITLLEAFENIDSKYITSAQAMLGCAGAAKQTRARAFRPGRRALICLAAVLALLISSLTVAMAVSEDVREWVLSIFRAGETERLPDNTDVKPPEGGFEAIGGSSFEDLITTRYFKGSGVVIPSEGIVYTCPYHGTEPSQYSFYELRDGALSPLETKRVEFPYSFDGTDFNIRFDYTVYNGEPHFRVFPDGLDLDPYRYGWNIYSAGMEDLAWLTLPGYDSLDYGNGVYPLLLDLETGEVTDVLAGLDLTDVLPALWSFSKDMRFALLSNWDERYWICDIGDRTLTSLEDLTGREIIDCYLMDGESVICKARAGEGFDVIRLDPETGEIVTLVEGTKYYRYHAGGSGYREIEYYGGQGRHGLIFDGQGGVTLIDLRDGRRMPLEGIAGGDSLQTSESPDGEHILFAWKDEGVNAPNTMAMYRLGLLDTGTGVLTVLERENYQVRSETILGWLGNGAVAVLAFDENDKQAWYMYVYDFGAA